jgi:hypothetical protein
MFAQLPALIAYYTKHTFELDSGVTVQLGKPCAPSVVEIAF